jgi:hypothetical protein
MVYQVGLSIIGQTHYLDLFLSSFSQWQDKNLNFVYPQATVNLQGARLRISN